MLDETVPRGNIRKKQLCNNGWHLPVSTYVHGPEVAEETVRVKKGDGRDSNQATFPTYCTLPVVPSAFWYGLSSPSS